VTPQETLRRRVLIKGRVQGVGFRWSCRRMAEAQGLAGWCRNLPDGRVEACFEGDPAAVEAALAWCREGPSSAIVTSVDVTAETPQGERGFRLG
jgi:acylphosphatase